MVDALDRALAASHDLADLGVGKVLHELEDQQVLPFGRQAADQAQERLLLLGADEGCLRVVAFGGQDGQVVDGNFLPAAAVAVPVGNQVVSDAIQPGGKR